MYSFTRKAVTPAAFLLKFVTDHYILTSKESLQLLQGNQVFLKPLTNMVVVKLPGLL
jgi:hypothetical protein